MKTLAKKIHLHKKYIILLLTFLSLFSLLILIYYFIYLEATNPPYTNLETRDYPQSTIIYDKDNAEIFRFFKDIDRQKIEYEEIPISTINAILAAEDKNFFSNPGIDPKGLIYCSVKTVISEIVPNSNAEICGASTITQQLVRNTILKDQMGQDVHKRTLSRKFRELILAFQITNHYSKEEILEIYLNEIPYGGQIYGIDTASQVYFEKHAQDLTLAQSAYLAGMIQQPSVANPISGNLEVGIARQEYVLDQLENNPDIFAVNNEEIQKARIEDLDFASTKRISKFPHFMTYIQNSLSNYGIDPLQSYTEGFRIETTLDSKLQKDLEMYVSEKADPLLSSNNATNLGILILDPKTGNILAMMGSKDFFESSSGQVNTLLSHREHGGISTTYTFAQALESGLKPYSVVGDFQEIGEEYNIKNLTNDYLGVANFQESLTTSRNISAMYTYNTFDSNLLREKLAKIPYKGVDINDYSDQDIVLGTNFSRLIDHASAYTSFVNQGIAKEAYGINSIKLAQGEAKYQNENQGTQLFSKETSTYINSMLCNFNLSEEFLYDKDYYIDEQIRMCGKTGLSQGLTDYTSITYSNNLLIATWVGNNENNSMNSADSNPALKISTNLIKDFNLSVDPITLEDYPELEEFDVCRYTGRVENQFICKDRYTGYKLKTDKIGENLKNFVYICSSDLGLRAAQLENVNVVIKPIINGDPLIEKYQYLYDRYFESKGYQQDFLPVGICP